MKYKKTILVLLDGLADRVHRGLGDKTPLEAAQTPNLDALCRRAETGMMVPWKPGVPLGTETAHFILFGYGIEDFPGRAAIEALGEGLPLKDKEIYLRATLAGGEEREGLFIRQRLLGDITPGEIKELASCLPTRRGGVSFSWTYSFKTHGFITLQGEGLSPHISDSDPFYSRRHVMEVEAFETREKEAHFTAKALNGFLWESYQRLKEHPVNQKRLQAGKDPANLLLTKWAGTKKELTPFAEKNGMTSLVLGASGLLKGVALSLGMDYQYCGDLGEGVKKALEIDRDLVHLHTKEPDEAAHTGDPQKKARVIEGLDQALGPLLGQDDILLVVTADHTTPSSGTLIHSGEPVPVMFIGEGIRTDQVQEFGERSCARGSLRITGADLIPMILNYTDRALLYGLRPGARRIGYLPPAPTPLEGDSTPG